MSTPSASSKSVAARSSLPATATGARRTLGALVACHTINDFYGLVMPPLLPAVMRAFELSHAQVAVVPFVTTALSAVLQPTLGHIADRHQLRKLFMAAGFVMFALSMLWIGTTSTYLSLLIAAGFLGLSASTYHPQSATLLAHYFANRRGWAQGIHGIGNGLGFLLAPLVVGTMADQLGWRQTAMLLAIPAAVAVVIVVTGLREPDIRGGEGILAGITRPLVLLTAVNGLAMGVSTAFITWLPSFYDSRGFSLAAAGAFTGIMSISALVAQPIGGTLSDRLGRRNLIVASFVGMGGFQLLFLAVGAITTGWPLLVAVTVLVNFWASLMPPVTMVYASEVAAGERTGMAVGVVWGLGTLVGSVAPLLTGVVIDASGFPASYLALGLLSLFGAYLAGRLPGKRPDTAD